MTAEPKTLEDYENKREKILSFMGNINLGYDAYLSLSAELEKVDIKIEELNSEL